MPRPVHHFGVGVPSLPSRCPQVSISPQKSSGPSSPGSSLRRGGKTQPAKAPGLPIETGSSPEAGTGSPSGPGSCQLCTSRPLAHSRRRGSGEKAPGSESGALVLLPDTPRALGQAPAPVGLQCLCFLLSGHRTFVIEYKAQGADESHRTTTDCRLRRQTEASDLGAWAQGGWARRP